MKFYKTGIFICEERGAGELKTRKRAILTNFLKRWKFSAERCKILILGLCDREGKIKGRNTITKKNFI